MIMRLRRSDFDIWDYSKRKVWKQFLHSIRNRYETNDTDFLAWMMLRANNSRALYAIRHRVGFLKWLVAVATANDSCNSSFPPAKAKIKDFRKKLLKSMSKEDREYFINLSIQLMRED